MRIAALIVALTVALSVMAGERPPVVLRVRPHVMFPGQSLWVDAWVAPHADNRLLVLEAEPSLALSEWSLEGERAPTIYRRRWVAGEPGEYLVSARIYDQRHQLRGYAQQRIIVSD